MAVTVKSLVTLTTATLALLIGFIWLRKRKKPKPLETPESPAKKSVASETKMDPASECDCEELFLQDEKLLFITNSKQLVTSINTENEALDCESDVPVVDANKCTCPGTNAKTSTVIFNDDSLVCESHDSSVTAQDREIQANAASEQVVVAVYSGLQGSTDQDCLNEREEACCGAVVCSSVSVKEAEDGSSELSDTCAVEQPVTGPECKINTTEAFDDVNCFEEQKDECISGEVAGSKLSQEGVVDEEGTTTETVLVSNNDVAECESETRHMTHDHQAKVCHGSMIQKEVSSCDEQTVVTSDTSETIACKDKDDCVEARNNTEVSSEINAEQKPNVQMQSEAFLVKGGQEQSGEPGDKLDEIILKPEPKSSQKPTSAVQKKYPKPSQQSDAVQQKTNSKSGQKLNKMKSDAERDGVKKKNNLSTSRWRKDFTKRQRTNKANNNVDTKPFVSSRVGDGIQTTYEFDFPTSVCGMLIGRMGRHVNQIKDLSGVEISVRHKMYTNEHQLVILKGTQAQIETALVLLRERFPIDRFPDVTFEPAEKELPVINLEQMQLTLPEGPPIEVQVSSVVAPNHVFLQQPSHPSFHMLETLNQSMNACYAQDGIVPQLPRPIEVGVICAAPVLDTGWYRAQVVESYPETDEVELKFLDYGGYMGIQGCMLRQIRCDFSQLPFQAVECYLANVIEPTDSGIFPPEANEIMQQLVKGKLLQAQVVGHEVDGVPYVQLYDVQDEPTLSINKELVSRGIAQSVEALENDKQVAGVTETLESKTDSFHVLADDGRKETFSVTPRSHVHLSENPESGLKSPNSCATVEKSVLNQTFGKQSGDAETKVGDTVISGPSASVDTARHTDDAERTLKESDVRDENKKCSLYRNGETTLKNAVESTEGSTVLENTNPSEENGAVAHPKVFGISSTSGVRPSGNDANGHSLTESKITDNVEVKDNEREQLMNVCEGTERCTEATGSSTMQTVYTGVINCDHETRARHAPVERTLVDKTIPASTSELSEETGITSLKDKGKEALEAKQCENEKALKSNSSCVSEGTAEEQGSSFHKERSASVQADHVKETADTCHTNKPTELNGIEKTKPECADAEAVLETLPSKLDDCTSAVSKEQLNSANTKTDKAPPVELSTTTEEEISNTLGNLKKTAAVPSTSSNSPNFMNSAGSSEIGSNDHDLHSEISADSGRGGSVAEMSSPARSPSNTPTVYQFDFPTVNCGMLIGKKGRQINRIKDLSGVEISVRHKKFTDEFNLVVLEGTQAQIEKALELLRERFPLDKFPDITFEPAEQDQPVLRPEHMQLSLPEGVPIDVLVSSVVAPNHVFLQQPTHPTFHMLQLLNDSMNACYSQADMVPQLPRPIEVGVICAAPVVDAGWYRAQVVESYPETDEVELRFLDYGGYMWIQGSLLRQIRYDFSQLPFQAYECYLANVVPPEGAETFSSDATAIMQQLVHNRVLQAQVVGHEVDSVPYVQLYELQGDQALLINKELVTRGVAQWVEQQS